MVCTILKPILYTIHIAIHAQEVNSQQENPKSVNRTINVWDFFFNTTVSVLFWDTSSQQHSINKKKLAYISLTTSEGVTKLNMPK